MDTVSISELKIRPSKTIEMATDYPVAVENRNQVKAYLVGKELYEKIIGYIEDYLDRAVVNKTDFSKGEDFEKVAKELGI
jgi:PHD/YefM family antitoxin component YafN of YafNO toxin-antitoxin module